MSSEAKAWSVMIEELARVRDGYPKGSQGRAALSYALTRLRLAAIENGVQL